MSTSRQETTSTSLATIAILAAAALFGVLGITVVTIPMQEAFADKPSGCDKKSNGYESSGGNCRKHHH
jgi:hypothetical protein